MKLSEIVLMVNQSNSKLKSYVNHISDEKLLGKSEGFDVYLGTIDGHGVYVARTVDGEFIGYVIFKTQALLGKEYVQPKYTYFDTHFQNKGFATALYMFIVKKLDRPIVSDGEQTQYGKGLWAALAKKTDKCKIYDTQTNSIIDFDADLKDLYSTDERLGNRYFLILEQLVGIHKNPGPSKVLNENTRYVGTDLL